MNIGYLVQEKGNSCTLTDRSYTILILILDICTWFFMFKQWIIIHIYSTLIHPCDCRSDILNTNKYYFVGNKAEKKVYNNHTGDYMHMKNVNGTRDTFT